jgi:hypothetical protein
MSQATPGDSRIETQLQQAMTALGERGTTLAVAPGI